jgi:formylglycine-generating enzyme required for sulfatase activity
MQGNIWEWCEDEWHSNYDEAPKYGKAWNDNRSQNSAFIVRGGAWAYGPRYCRSAYRLDLGIDDDLVGFRPVFSVQDSSPLHS